VDEAPVPSATDHQVELIEEDVGEEEWRPPEDRVPRVSARGQHWLAMGWIVALALAVLGPALVRGSMIGTYDLLSGKGITARPGVVVHGSYINTDPVLQMIPWTQLNWTQVHHGMVPLWNPLSGMGLPLAFNWQSASFSVVSLVGYALPLHYAYTGGVILTLVIAGSGVYVLGRVLGLGFLGSVLAATVFELSGPLVAWLGYPQAQVMAWGGWLFAAGLLVIRGRRRALSVTFFAVIVACSVYAGHPESLIVMVGAFVLFAGSVLILRDVSPRFRLDGGPIGRPALDLTIGSVAGAALSAPLLLPALQVTFSSVRTTARATPPPPLHNLTYFLFSSYDGVPVSGNYGFGGAFYYDETAAYVGIIAIVLATVGMACAVRRRRVDLLALLAPLGVMLALVFALPVINALNPVPHVGQVNLLRGLMPCVLLIAVLAGVGADALCRRPTERYVRQWLLAGFTVLAVVLVRLWAVQRSEGLPTQLTHIAQDVRNQSFIWPFIGLGVGWALTAWLFLRPRSGRWVVAVLLVVESAFLVSAGAIQIGSSADGAAPTPAVTALQRAVGSATVGGGSYGPIKLCALGIPPEANIFFGIHQVDTYDPIVPKAYFDTWQAISDGSPGSADLDLFCPQFTTVAQARTLGVSYLLIKAGSPGPPGAVFVRHLRVPLVQQIGNPLANPPPSVDLYRVPGASQASAVPEPRPGVEPDRAAGGADVPIDQDDPSTWSMTTSFADERVLRLHLSDLPGWAATIDGRPLALRTFAGSMLEATVPAGHHVVVVHYWPKAFTYGLWAFLAGVLGLGGWLAFEQRVRRRRSPGRSAGDPSTGSGDPMAGPGHGRLHG
jgi:hypothetical protein